MNKKHWNLEATAHYQQCEAEAKKAGKRLLEACHDEGPKMSLLDRERLYRQVSNQLWHMVEEALAHRDFEEVARIGRIGDLTEAMMETHRNGCPNPKDAVEAEAKAGVAETLAALSKLLRRGGMEVRVFDVTDDSDDDGQLGNIFGLPPTVN